MLMFLFKPDLRGPFYGGPRAVKELLQTVNVFTLFDNKSLALFSRKGRK